MAGDWIMMRHDLADDPAVIGIGSACIVPRQHVVGALHGIWSWFDKHSVDGRGTGATVAFIDELAGIEGFAKAMEKVGWLRVTDSAVSIPKFKAFMAQSAKQRQLTARRVARHRKRDCNAPGVTKSLPENSTAEPEYKREKNRNSAGSADAEPPETSVVAADAVALLAGIVPNKPTGAAAGKNDGRVILEIQDLMAARGCDVAFRGTVARYANVRTVRKLAAEFDRERSKIANEGGWWRDQLRRAGVKGI